MPRLSLSLDFIRLLHPWYSCPHVVATSADCDYGDLRWTVDTPQDLEAVRQIYEYFQGDDSFSWLEVIDLYQLHPELKEINRSVMPKTLKITDERAST